MGGCLKGGVVGGFRFLKTQCPWNVLLHTDFLRRGRDVRPGQRVLLVGLRSMVTGTSIG